MITRRQPAACRSAASRSSVTITPLPAARPSSLTTYGGPNSSRAATTSPMSTAEPRVGGRHAGRRHDLLGEGLAALQRAAARRGAEDRDTGRADGVRDSGDQRRLRADTTRSAVSWTGECGHRVPVDRRPPGGWCRPSPCPGCRGRMCTGVTPGSRLSAQASACSRPPDPITNTVSSLPGDPSGASVP